MTTVKFLILFLIKGTLYFHFASGLTPYVVRPAYLNNGRFVQNYFGISLRELVLEEGVSFSEEVELLM